MKRAEDFKSFMSSLRSPEESVMALPDFPMETGSEFIFRVAKEFPVAEDPFEKSEMRSGLKVWDSAYLPLPKSVPVEPIEFGGTKPLRGINDEWEGTKKALDMIGRPDGVHYIRPKGEFIVDVMNDDLRLLQGAHIITHRALHELADDDYTFGETSDAFLEALAKLCLARKFGLGVCTHPEKGVIDATDSFDTLGIKVCVSTDLRNPEVSIKQRELAPDGTVAIVLCSVGIEAPPAKSHVGTGSWREVNRWSSMPTLVTLAGWECVDFITHSARRESADGPVYSVPVADLQGMSSFKDLLEKAGEHEIPMLGDKVDEWLESDDFRTGLSYTPQLPCRHCIRISPKANGAVKRPRSQKPKITVKEMGRYESLRPDMQEWKDYSDYMRGCIETGRKATAFASGSPVGMKKRNLAAAKRHVLMKRIAALEKKCVKKRFGGYITEAEEIRNKIEEMRKELENGKTA